jgi:NitT/TauT family transport system substrate-binding protein
MMARMSGAGPEADRVLTAIAAGSEDTLASYKEQLSTTRMFYTPQSAVEFGASANLKQTMDLVRRFCFDHGLLGSKSASADEVAIGYPDGFTQGKRDQIKLRFDVSYMQMAAQGKL